MKNILQFSTLGLLGILACSAQGRTYVGDQQKKRWIISEGQKILQPGTKRDKAFLNEFIHEAANEFPLYECSGKNYDDTKECVEEYLHEYTAKNLIGRKAYELAKAHLRSCPELTKYQREDIARNFEKKYTKEARKLLREGSLISGLYNRIESEIPRKIKEIRGY